MAATPRAVILYPGYSAEDEYPMLERLVAAGGGGAVELPVLHTWVGPTAHDVEALLDLGSETQLRPAARRAAERGGGSVMWACTSASFVYGSDGVIAQAAWMTDETGVPASSTSLALIEALRSIGSTEVTIAATYPAPVTEHLVRLLTDAGIAVVHADSHDVPSGEAAGALAPEQVRAMIAAAAAEQPEGTLVVPDTALHTVELVEGLETELGRTILTANQVSAWWGLRLAGWTGRAEGLGTLFRGR